MRIVVLDGHTLNPGDLSWQDLEALGNCSIHARTPASETVARSADAEIILTNKVPLGREQLRQLPKLRYIGVLATGVNVVDLDAARERGIIVTNVPDYSTPSVAQTVFAHLLHLTHHVAEHGASVRSGAWSSSADFCYWNFPLLELDSLTLGLVGYGRIARKVACIGQALGMQLLVHTRSCPQLPAGAEHVDLDELFRRSDVVSLHCPLSEQTHHLVDARRLALMKSSAFLINTGRGPLIDEPALAAALNAGKLAGAGLDVLSSEPPSADNCLLQARNCWITPHLAWASTAARRRLMQIAVANVRAFVAGTPANVVSG